MQYIINKIRIAHSTAKSLYFNPEFAESLDFDEDHFYYGIEDGLSEQLEESFIQWFQTQAGDDINDILEKNIRDSIEKNIRDSIEKNIRDNIEKNIRDNIEKKH